MSGPAGARVLAILLTVAPVASLACALNCAAPTTQVSAHECHGVTATADTQISASDSCADYPVPVATLTNTPRYAQAPLALTAAAAPASSSVDRRFGSSLAQPDTGPPFHARPILGLRI